MERDRCQEISPCKGCENAEVCSPPRKTGQQDRRLEDRLSRIRRKVMIMSGKGGVGKTTVTANLAASLALKGFRVGILDADIHGPNIPKMLGVENQYLLGSDGGVEPVEVFKNLRVVSVAFLGHDRNQAVIWRGPLKQAAIKQFLGDVHWGHLDFLVIDLPPGTGDEPLAVANLIKNVDGSIIVTTPQDVAVLDSRKAVSFSKLLKVPVLGIVENMAGMCCPHCGGRIDLFKVGGGEKAAAELHVPFLGRIPIDPLMVEQCDTGKPLAINSTYSEAGEAYIHLAQKVLGILEPQKEEAGSAAQ